MAAHDDNNQAPAETLETIQASRIVGWYRASADLEPLLAYARAQDRVLTDRDVGKTAWDVISDLMEIRYQEIERGE